MVLGVALLITGWMFITFGTRSRRVLTILGCLMVTAAMLSIVQAHY